MLKDFNVGKLLRIVVDVVISISRFELIIRIVYRFVYIHWQFLFRRTNIFFRELIDPNLSDNYKLLYGLQRVVNWKMTSGTKTYTALPTLIAAVPWACYSRPKNAQSNSPVTVIHINQHWMPKLSLYIFMNFNCLIKCICIFVYHLFRIFFCWLMKIWSPNNMTSLLCIHSLIANTHAYASKINMNLIFNFMQN